MLHFPVTHPRRASVSPLPPGAALFVWPHSNLPSQGWLSRSLSPVSRFPVIIPLAEAPRGPRDGNRGAQEKQALPRPISPLLGGSAGPWPAHRCPAQTPGPHVLGHFPEGVRSPAAWPRGKPPLLATCVARTRFGDPGPARGPEQKAGPRLPGTEMRPGREGEKRLGGACVCRGGR